MAETSDPLGLRGDAPLFDAYLRRLEAGLTPFTIPGHKQRTGLIGPIVDGDLPLHGGVDTVRLSGGLLVEAERRAADHWGADRCRFSTGGSTHGNQALALAVARPGDAVVVSRTLHRSLLLGLVLAGLEPIWVTPEVDPVSGMPRGVDPAAVATALDRHPEARAVFVGDPSYVGTFGDVASLAEVAHRRDVPLVVDAAWGAHFGAHPDLPPHPLSAGADAMVTSAHKTLPAMSPGALIAIRATRVDPDRFERAVDATHTTSPSGAVLASIDAARALLAGHGARLLGTLIGLVAEARRELAAIPGVEVLSGPDVDPTKLVVRLELPIGVEVDRRVAAAGLPVEMSDPHTLVPMLTIGDDSRTIGLLVDAVRDAIQEIGGASASTSTSTSAAAAAARAGHTRTPTLWTIEPETVVSPRDAFFAPHETVTADAAVDRISAELIAPYPPGIPVLAPGERITAATLTLLRAAQQAGTRIAYAADPSLTTLQVLAMPT